MPRPLTRLHRFGSSLVQQYLERLEHDRGLADPRVASEHRIAHSRSLDEGGDGCTFCR
ncbi:MAG: hypothetical protein ABSF58_12785 [Solirubrobacteraceae bacterium]|jgi:hypothetical protein